MAALTVDAVRARVAAAGAAVSGWSQAPVPFELFFDFAVRSSGHKTFAVGVPSTERFRSVDEFITASAGAMVETEIVVRWLYRTGRGEDPATSLDVALVAEQALTLGLLLASAANLALHWESWTREITEEGWLHGEIVLRAGHSIAFVTNPA